LYVATTTGGGFAIKTSKDLVNWKSAGAIFPNGKGAPKWAKAKFWAPEITYVASKKRYYASFTAADEKDLLCIGIASAPHYLGPWTSRQTPIVKDKRVGNIDSTLLYNKAKKAWYLVWKQDGNGWAKWKKTPIMARQLDNTLMNFKKGSKMIKLIENNLGWEGPIVEAPSFLYRKPYYYLFYSGNGYWNKYAVGIARSKSALGPYKKHPKPVMQSSSIFAAPGHCSVVQMPKSGTHVMIYHAYRRPNVGDGHPRFLMVDKVIWKNGWPTIKGRIPSSTPQKIPK
jgi:beta-xylosidase